MELDKIKELLEIDLTSPSGLRWKVTRTGTALANGIVGGLQSNGHYRMKIDNKDYYNHRIIYALYHNLEIDQLPKYLDHIDRNPSNNNPLNLRPATLSQNQGNRSLSKNNTSGIKGVSWNKKAQKWKAVLMMNGINTFLGYFEDIEVAKRVYEEASRSYFGEFSNTS